GLRHGADAGGQQVVVRAARWRLDHGTVRVEVEDHGAGRALFHHQGRVHGDLQARLGAARHEHVVRVVPVVEVDGGLVDDHAHLSVGTDGHVGDAEVGQRAVAQGEHVEAPTG